MSDNLHVRDLDRDDLLALRTILDRTGLFPSDLLADMAEPWLRGDAPHHWLVACWDGEVAGFAYAEPERMTEGTHNLLAIAVEPDLQRTGIGKRLVAGLATRLRSEGGRILLVETSSLDEYAATRGFYADLGFVPEARIRDFYRDGEDKITFWTRL